MAVIYGRLEIFDSRVEVWTQYVERLEAYFQVNSITDDAKQRAILQTVLEPATYTLLRNLTRPLTIPDKTYKELVTLLKQHFDPVPSKIIERFHFYNRDRKEGESVAVYVSELRRMTEHCSFGANLDEMIRDRIVCGINDGAMQRRLLTEDDSLTLTDAIRTVQTMETATHNTQRIRNGENHAVSSDMSTNHVLAKETNRQESSIRRSWHRPDQSQSTSRFVPSASQCNRCTSRSHRSHECPFIREKCFKCEKIGHIAKACQSASMEKTAKQHEVNHRKPRTNHIGQGQQPSRDYEFPVHNIATQIEEPDVTTPPPDRVTCLVNGININFEADTGSGHTMITEEVFRRIPNTEKLTRFRKTLRSYTGEPVRILGTTTVSVSYNSRKVNLPVLVVQSQGPNLCGRRWLYSQLQILPHVNPLDRIHYVNLNSSKLEKILKKHEQIFSPGLGKLRGVQAHLHIKPEAIPKYCKARTVPYSMTEKVEAELQRMVNEDIIESIPFSRYASPIVPVVKANGSIRICGDFSSTANPAINTEVYPLPRAQDIFSKLAGSKYFTKIDLREAYNQIELDEESRKIAVINTSKGLYQYRRLPFGLSSSSAIFQRHMEMVVNGMDKVSPFQDDILLGSKTEEEHFTQIDQFLTIARNSGLKLRREKCHFFVTEVEFLGHRLNAEGLQPLNSKMEEIMQAPEPENVETLRSFLGMINYYGRFLPNHASNMAPLHKLLHKGTPWTWTKEHKDAFHQAKLALKTSGVLVHYDINKEVYLSCDASPFGLGGVISHMIKDVSGKFEERPISFASRSLTPAEKNYSQLEREALAIIFSVMKFRDYLYGKKFTLMTDHQPLVSLLSPDKPIPQMAAARIQRWALLLSAFQYQIKFRRGSANQNADALSRMPLPHTATKTPVPAEYVLLMKEIDRSPINSLTLEKLTTQDPILSKVLRYMRQNFPTSKLDNELEPYKRRQTELSNFDDIIFIGNRIVIPKSCQAEFLRDLHSTHQGIVQMKSVARSRFWWPTIDRDIEMLVKQCNVCQENSSMPAATFQSWPAVQQPWERVHADFAGPIEGRYLFIVVDAYSKWLEVNVTRSTSTETVTECLRDHIARFGIMLTLVTDNGPCFTRHEFREFITMNGINHLTTAPYHPQSNGQAERSVRIIKTGIKKLNGDMSEEVHIVNNGLNRFQSGRLETRLARLLLNYRRTPLLSGKSPAELMLGRNIVTRLDLCHPGLRSVLGHNGHDKDKVEKTIADHDHESTLSKFVVNEPVYLRNFGKGEKWKKGIITRHLGKMMYEVETEYGGMRRHQNQIRPRLEQADERNIKIAESTNWTPKTNKTSDQNFPAHDNSQDKQRSTELPIGNDNASQSQIQSERMQIPIEPSTSKDQRNDGQQHEIGTTQNSHTRTPVEPIVNATNHHMGSTQQLEFRTAPEDIPAQRQRPKRNCHPPDRYTEIPNAWYKA